MSSELGLKDDIRVTSLLGRCKEVLRRINITQIESSMVQLLRDKKKDQNVKVLELKQQFDKLIDCRLVVADINSVICNAASEEANKAGH